MDSERARYYEIFFPKLLTEGLLRFITCNNLFTLEECELAPRYVHQTSGADMMQRHLIFRTGDELSAFCIRHKPHNVQIGGVLPLIPNSTDDKSNRETARALIKTGLCTAYGPLILDIDVNDYNRTGVCDCTGAVCCNRCWTVFIETARRVCRYVLQTVYGLRGIFEVFSGRRGIHIWCVDKRVCKWSNDERASFVTRFMAIQTAHDFVRTHVLCDILRPAAALYFPTLHMEEQEIFNLLFPRLDAEVTKSASHLKGMPLSLHHATGYIRITLPPLDHAKGHVFDLTRNCCKPSSMSYATMRLFLKPIIDALNETQ